MDKAIEAVISAVQQASPALWAAAQQKVAADVALAQTLLCVFVAGVVLGAALLYYGSLEYHRDAITALGLILLIVCALGGLFAYSEYSQKSRAPQWYAIRALADLSPVK